MTFEAFLRECVAKQSDPIVHVALIDGERIAFRAHPMGYPDSVVRFAVDGNALTRLDEAPVHNEPMEHHQTPLDAG